MAPQKRSRIEADSEEEVIAVESASSSLRQEGSNKKQRLSVNQSARKPTNARNGQADESSDESEDEIPDADDGPPAGTQYDIMRDDNFRHVANPELDDQRMTQAFLRREGNRIGENRAADNSIIEEITCINFMCHDKLHVQLGPLINFVVGMNGSGKSAVLTAITLCLGGKVASTNRGSSLKSMIKTGRDHAMLIIKMKNQGQDAYQPDLYGKSIIIERHFSSTGSSNYKLKNALGKTVSSRKGDVDDIIEYYQLQVDNPMNVLTQDAAKSFIQTSTPAQKYEFFHKGVQLDALDNDYRLLSDTCDDIAIKLRDGEEGVAVLKKRAEDAAIKFQAVQQHGGMRAKLRGLSHKLAWSQVDMVEKDLDLRQKEVASYEQKIQDSEARIEAKSQEFEAAERNLAHATESRETVKEGFQPLQQEEEVAKTAHDEATNNVAACHTKLRGMKEDLREAGKKVKDYKTKIARELQLAEEANGGALTQKLAELAEAEQAAEDARVAENQHKEAFPRLDHERRAAQEAYKNIEGPLEAKRQDLASATDRLQSLNRDTGNVMAGFDQKMPQVIQAIKHDSGFLEKPVGPMGLHIKLRNPTWSNIIESALGSTLTGFIVTSKVDQVRLAALLRKHGMVWCPIIIGNHQPIDTTGHEPDEQFETILRVLDIDNELVRRQLIISAAIEQSILVPKRSDGFKVMYEGPKPVNVRQCFCLHDTDRGVGHLLRHSGGRDKTNVDMSPVYAPKGKPRMQTDIAKEAAYQRQTVSQLESELKAIDGQKRQLLAIQQKCESAVKRHAQETNRLKISVQRADTAVDSAKAEVDKYQLDDGVVDGLRISLQEAELQLGIIEESYGNSGLERDTLNEAALEKKRELDGIRAKIRDYEFSVNKADEKVRRLEHARRLILVEKNEAINYIAELRLALERATRKRNAQAENVASHTTEARKICERVLLEPRETYEKLQIEFNQLKDRLKKVTQALGGTDDEIQQAAIDTDRVWCEQKKNLGDLQEILVLLKQAILKRMDMYRRFQRFISSRSRINFNYLLSERAFRGKLIIDHKAKKLDVHVEPDETLKSGKGRQTKTLSGGEKSYSSICLLLALWEAMGAPLRCLDEFDVFMDDVNRDVSSKLIITGARRSVGRQFILISPKALGSGAAIGPDVKVIKLNDPREKQRTLDEMVQDE